MTTLSPENMTAAEITALMKQLRDVQKVAREAESARYSELAREFLETVLAEHGVEPSDYSERVGHSTQNLSIEVDGRAYTFYVAIKDVKASEERKAAIDTGAVTLKKREPKKKADTKADTQPDTDDTDEALLDVSEVVEVPPAK